MNPNVSSKLPRFSVLMAIYAKDTPAHLELALRSIAAQSLRRFEIVIVKDGKLTRELEQILEKYFDVLTPIFVELPRQMGLNSALNAGIDYCRNDIIIRCDSDDINLPDRFLKQVSFLAEYPEIAIVGSQVIEFVQTRGGITLRDMRVVPRADVEIRAFSKFRSPFNHPSVAYRKTAVIDAGKYNELKKTKLEDYGLWLRMLGKQYKGANFDEALVLFRAGSEMISRRRGLDYVLDEISFIPEKVQSGMTTYTEAILIGIPRIMLRFLSSKFLRFMYNKFLRHKIKDYSIDEKDQLKLGIQVYR